MPRKKENARAASGTGTIRKKTVTRNGKEYPYWEARYTVGFDPAPGNRFSAPSQARHRKKLPKS